MYAKSLQMELPRALQRSVAIEIYQEIQNDPKSLFQEAKRKVATAKKERNAYSAVWLFFDHDNYSQLKTVFELASKEGFEVAYTAICIEHWFIMHFEHCARAFKDPDAAIRHLKKLWPNYHKTKINAYKALRPQLQNAIERASLLMKNQDNEVPMHLQNPFFTIIKLVRFFEELKGNSVS